MIQKAGIALGLLILVALAVPPGAPLHISYVASDSMSPTIDTNEGYVLVPVDAVQPGDIITFYNLWRLTDYLIKAVFDVDLRDPPVITGKTFATVLGQFLLRLG